MLPLYQERQALGCRVQMCLIGTSETVASDLMRELWIELLSFEQRCSRFLPQSELSRFNRSAGVRQLVSPELHDILLKARQMADLTNGLFNPFVLPALQRAGYVTSRAAGHEKDRSDSFANRKLVSAEKLELGADWASIPYGTALDLGGCGKGYIGDVLARRLQNENQVSGFWLSIGGDTITYGSDSEGNSWKVYLQPDPKSTQRIGEVQAQGQGIMAVATSSTSFRQGTRAGKKWHHLIDPRTGQPAQSAIELAVVCSSSLLTADVLASCVIIDNARHVQQMAEAHAVQSVAWRANGQLLRVHGQGIKAYPTVDKHDWVHYDKH